MRVVYVATRRSRTLIARAVSCSRSPSFWLAFSEKYRMTATASAGVCNEAIVPAKVQPIEHCVGEVIAEILSRA